MGKLIANPLPPSGKKAPSKVGRKGAGNRLKTRELRSLQHAKEKTKTELRKLILVSHYQCTSSAMATAEYGICCGEHLTQLKLLVGHGDFEAEIKSSFSRETGLSLRTAQRYMNHYRRFLLFLHQQNAAPSSPQAIATSQTDLLRDFCRKDRPTRSGDEENGENKPSKKAKKASPKFLAAIQKFFGDEERIEQGRFQVFSENRGFVSVHELSHPYGETESLLRQVKTGSINELILWVRDFSEPLPEQLWQFPIAIARGPATSMRPVFVYLSLSPRLGELESCLSDMAVVFVPANLPTDTVRAISFLR